MTEPTVVQQIAALRDRYQALSARVTTENQAAQLRFAALSINSARDFTSLPDLARVFVTDAARELDLVEQMIEGVKL